MSAKYDLHNSIVIANASNHLWNGTFDNVNTNPQRPGGETSITNPH